MTDEHDLDPVTPDEAMPDSPDSPVVAPTQDPVDIGETVEVVDEPDDAAVSAVTATNDQPTRDPAGTDADHEAKVTRETLKKAHVPKPEAGIKPHKSATKAGRSKKKSHYNPGKTPPKPIEMKDHSPWWIPWLGTSMIVIALILLVLSYTIGNLPPFGSYWVFVCFGIMTLGLIVLSRWK